MGQVEIPVGAVEHHDVEIGIVQLYPVKLDNIRRVLVAPFGLTVQNASDIRARTGGRSKAQCRHMVIMMRIRIAP
jgi:hypothetical protein